MQFRTFSLFERGIEWKFGPHRLVLINVVTWNFLSYLMQFRNFALFERGMEWQFAHAITVQFLFPLIRFS